MHARDLIGLLPVVALCLAATGGSVGAQEKLTLATANASISLVLSRAAVEKGYFKAEGLDVELKVIPGGNDAIQALAGGSVEFGESSHAQFLAATAKNLPIVAIGLHSYGFLGKLIAAQRNTNLATLAEFKGKRIGIQVGTGVYTVFMMALDRAGLKESDFVLTNIRVNDMPAAMQGDTFDAVLAWEPQATRIVQSGKGKEVIGTRKFEEIADITYPFMILTTEKMVRERPATVQKYLNGFARSQRFVLREKKEAVALLRKILPAQVASTLSDEDLEFQLYGTSYFDRIVFNDRDMGDLKRTAEHMVRQKTIQSNPDLAKVINTSYARSAAAKLGN